MTSITTPCHQAESSVGTYRMQSRNAAHPIGGSSLIGYPSIVCTRNLDFSYARIITTCVIVSARTGARPYDASPFSGKCSKVCYFNTRVWFIRQLGKSTTPTIY
jgi:hypothetical protein